MDRLKEDLDLFRRRFLQVKGCWDMSPQCISHGAHVHLLTILDYTWQRTEEHSSPYKSRKTSGSQELTFCPDSHDDQMAKRKQRAHKRAHQGAFIYSLFSRPATRSFLAACTPAGIISIPPPEPIKSLKLLILLLTSPFFPPLANRSGEKQTDSSVIPANKQTTSISVLTYFQTLQERTCFPHY